MIITTTETIPGKEIIKIIGIARGSIVKTKHFGKDILAGLTNLVGGEIEAYSELMEETRADALKRMVRHAKLNEADAIVNVRFMTSEIIQGAAEILAYGTAVKIAKESGDVLTTNTK
jgi:uncharacterized protein YbjQ (UPF0145 family)